MLFFEYSKQKFKFTMNNQPRQPTEKADLFYINESPQQFTYSSYQNYSQDKFYQTYEYQTQHDQKTQSHFQLIKDDTEMSNKPLFQTLDYGEKLAANHSILKDLLQMVDSKLTSRVYQKKKDPQKSDKSLDSKSESQNPILKHKLQKKLMIIRARLNEVIKQIDQQVPFEENQQILNQNLAQKWNKIVNIHCSEPIESKIQQKEVKQDTQILIRVKPVQLDRSKFDNAKQVYSQQFLNPSEAYLNDKQSKKSQMKSSLDKISESMNDQYFQKQETVKPVIIESKNVVIKDEQRNRNDQLLNQSISKQLDQTGRIIRSTINKTTVSTATLARPTTGRNQVKSSEQLKNQKEQQLNCKNLGNQIKKNKFWQGKNRVIVNETVNKSHRQQFNKLQEFQLKNKSELMKRIPSKQKKLYNKIYQESQQTSSNKMIPAPQKSLSSSMIKFNQSSPLKYDSKLIPSRNQIIQQKTTIEYSKENFVALNRYQNQRIIERNRSIPQFRQSNIIKQYRHQNSAYNFSGFANNPQLSQVRVINPEQNIIRPITQTEIRNQNQGFSKMISFSKYVQPSNRARSLPNNPNIIAQSPPPFIKKVQNFTNLQKSSVQNTPIYKNQKIFINNNAIRQQYVSNSNNIKRIIPKSSVIGRQIQFQERKNVIIPSIPDNDIRKNIENKKNHPLSSSIVEFLPIHRSPNKINQVYLPRVQLQDQSILQSRINHTSNKNLYTIGIPQAGTHHNSINVHQVIQVSAENKYQQKKQLSQIIQRSEQSVRNESILDRSDYIGSKKSSNNTSAFGNDGRRRLKRKGIEITNRVYFNNEESKLI